MVILTMALNNNSNYLEMHTQDVYIVFKVHKVKNVSVLPVFCWLPAASPHSRLSFLLASLSALVGKRFKVRNVILSKEISNWNTKNADKIRSSRSEQKIIIATSHHIFTSLTIFTFHLINNFLLYRHIYLYEMKVDENYYNIYINMYDYYKYHQSIFILINKIQINEYKIHMDQILNWVDCNIWVALPWVRSFPSCN